MSDGQGGNAPETIDDLSQFLEGNPDADAAEPLEEEESSTADEPETDNPDAETEEDAPADEDDEESSEKDAKQASDFKFKVPVKGEDGTETIVEVDQKELIAGYQRHADYTRKTMELGEREREVTQVLSTKLEEGRAYYLQQAQKAHAAVRQLAGLRSPEEMAQLAHTDQAEWVREQQRERAIGGVLTQLEQGMHAEMQQAQQKAAEAEARQRSHAWGVLGQQGLNQEKLVGIYKTIHERYKVPVERFAQVTDPALVLIMRDAAAYQELKDKKAAVVKQAKDAPKLPAARQSVPKNEHVQQKLNKRFATGRAKLGDLAAYLANS